MTDGATLKVLGVAAPDVLVLETRLPTVVSPLESAIGLFEYRSERHTIDRSRALLLPQGVKVRVRAHTSALSFAAIGFADAVIDRAVMAVSVAGVSVPVFFLGLLLIWFVGFKWQLLPFTGRAGPIWSWEGLRALILPAVTLGGVFVGPVARMTRTAVLDVLSADHVRTARAKGLTERLVVTHHALRNALIPVVTLIGLQIGFLLGGAVVTETVFSWPGVGRLAVGAILSSDLPMAQGTIIVLSVGFILVNLLVDILYAALAPRIRAA